MQGSYRYRVTIQNCNDGCLRMEEREGGREGGEGGGLYFDN